MISLGKELPLSEDYVIQGRVECDVESQGETPQEIQGRVECKWHPQGETPQVEGSCSSLENSSNKISL